MKIKELQEILKKRNIDFALFYNVGRDGGESNMTYFAQYVGIGALVIPSKSKPFLVVPKMEFSRAKEGIIDKVYIWDKEKRLFENIKGLLKKNRIRPKKISIDKNVFSLNAYRELKKHLEGASYLDVAGDCLKLREIKTKKEIEIIKKGCAISDQILKKCMDNFRKFKTESEVRAFLENETKIRGCELAFPTIVASGINAVKPHHITRDVKLKKGFCVIDFGIKYKNYCTDTTRTVYLGKINKKQRDIYNLVLDVQKETINNIKANKKCDKIYNGALKGLKTYGKYFTHGLGHGFGINIHELPNLTDKSKGKVKNNMVFTIEPGIYTDKFGIRIEDDVLIEDNTVKVLTKITKELKVVS
ncbi:MAG: Xaa-Pro peptidase family protein [Nanoarchaeota archaeon]